MTSRRNGISTSTVLFLIFLVLKLLGVIRWSWWWVTAPLWGSFLLVVLILGCVLLALAMRGRFSRR